MTILVTGASGFVGAALSQALARSGEKVRAIARDMTRIPAENGIEARQIFDLEIPQDWAPLLQDVRSVIHLAGIAHAGSHIPETRYDRVNRAATAALAQAAAKIGVQHFIFVSSIRAQTGPSSERVLEETQTPHPTDAYGRSKLGAEQAVRSAGVAFAILRPVAIYGAGVKGNMGALLRLADSPLPLPFGRLDQPRSVLSLDNLISATTFILANPSSRGETYIVADDTPVSLAEIIRIFRKGLGRSSNLLPVPPRLLKGALQSIGAGGIWERIGGRLVADAGKLRSAGWHPSIDAPGGLLALAQAASPRKSGTASRSTS